MRQLPGWFGIESALLEYVEKSKTLPTYAVEVDGEIEAVCLVSPHYAHAAEIELIAVEPTLHRVGYGRLLMTAVEKDLYAQGVEFLQAKTLGPSHPSSEYASTRCFYRALGYHRLEEIHGLWPDNPCLIMIKHLPSNQ